MEETSESWVVFESATGEATHSLASLGFVQEEDVCSQMERESDPVRAAFWNEGNFPLSKQAVTHQQMRHHQEGHDAEASSSRPMFSSHPGRPRPPREHTHTAYIFSVEEALMDPDGCVPPGRKIRCACCKQLLWEGQRIYHLPTRYNPRTKVFSATGIFCSGPCILGYDEAQFTPPQRHTSTIFLYLWQMHPDRTGLLIHTPPPIEYSVDEFCQGGLMTMAGYLSMLRGDDLWTTGEGGVGVVRRTEQSLSIVPDKLCLTLHYQQRSDVLPQLGPIPLASAEISDCMEVDEPAQASSSSPRSAPSKKRGPNALGKRQKKGKDVGSKRPKQTNPKKTKK